MCFKLCGVSALAWLRSGSEEIETPQKLKHVVSLRWLGCAVVAKKLKLHKA